MSDPAQEWCDMTRRIGDQVLWRISTTIWMGWSNPVHVSDYVSAEALAANPEALLVDDFVQWCHGRDDDGRRRHSRAAMDHLTAWAYWSGLMDLQSFRLGYLLRPREDT